MVNTHVCRGNYHSTYAFEGGYDPVAPYLFANEDVNAFYLEFDTPRAGGFEPLAHVAAGKKVVLGLVTSKQPGLEDEELLVRRIYEAAQYVPLEDLCLSPQCGFASCECGTSSPRRSSGPRSPWSSAWQSACGARIRKQNAHQQCNQLVHPRRFGFAASAANWQNVARSPRTGKAPNPNPPAIWVRGLI